MQQKGLVLKENLTQNNHNLGKLKWIKSSNRGGQKGLLSKGPGELPEV